MKLLSKMISFRLSSREYEQLHQFCLAKRTGSVSELARAAVNKLIRDPDFISDKALETRVNELEGQLQVLTVELKNLKAASASK